MSEKLKEVVKSKYNEIAKNSNPLNIVDCCGGSDCCGDSSFKMIDDEYKNLSGYNSEADLGLGCGVPTEFANMQVGQRVLDLGSGAGNDCFVIRSIVGEKGKVVGLDFSEPMLEKARKNAEKLKFDNIEFVLGDIEDLPFKNNQFDMVSSNCVLNLVPDKIKAFSEIHRVLNTNGHFCVSDVVTEGALPEALKNDVEMYVGCVAGAVKIDEYLGIIENAGFKNIEIHKKKKISIPESIIKKYSGVDNEEIGIYSITISAKK